MVGYKYDNFDRATIALYDGDDADQEHQTSVVSFINGGSDQHEPSDVSLPSLSDECIDWMVEREKEHMPRDDYVERLRNGELDLKLRKDSLNWIIRACTHLNFGVLCLYSAMSYLDRFLSVHEFAQKNRMVWATKLAAVACLSLAAKMQEINVPHPVDLQVGRPRCKFQGKTIHRMEIMISNVLKWRLNPYTPFSYIDFYLRKMSDDGELPPQHVITKAIGVILTTIEDIKFLEYKPSEIAAAVAMYALGDLQETDMSKTWLGVLKVEEGRVMKCLELIQGSEADSTITREDVADSRVGSPNRVLDVAACSSFESDQGTTTTGESEAASPENKRMKLNNEPTLEK